MDEVTFTKVRSLLPVMDEGANKDGKRYVLKRHKQSRLVLLSFEDYQKLVAAAGNNKTDQDNDAEGSIAPPAFTNK